MNKHGPPQTGLARLPLVAAVALSTATLATPTTASGDACSMRVLRAGFYAHFSPVSYSADQEPGSAGFDLHRGYEADLLTALEVMDGAGISFERRGIAEWDGIWLRSAGAEFDLVGGGITILESRTRDASGATRVTFTPGHVEFRQSLLVRSADARRLAEYHDLTADLRVGVLAATTGEARLLQIVGLSNQEGVLATGTHVEKPSGTVTADGSDRYTIRASGASPAVADRRRIVPPVDGMPQVIVYGDDASEQTLLDALRTGEIDALARGIVGNRYAADASGGDFTVTAIDSAIELGGFTLSADEQELADCIGAKIDWLTDGGRIGYSDWIDDPKVFLDRAGIWRPGSAE